MLIGQFYALVAVLHYSMLLGWRVALCIIAVLAVTTGKSVLQVRPVHRKADSLGPKTRVNKIPIEVPKKPPKHSTKNDFWDTSIHAMVLTLKPTEDTVMSDTQMS